MAVQVEATSQVANMPSSMPPGRRQGSRSSPSSARVSVPLNWLDGGFVFLFVGGGWV